MSVTRSGHTPGKIAAAAVTAVAARHALAIRNVLSSAASGPVDKVANYIKTGGAGVAQAEFQAYVRTVGSSFVKNQGTRTISGGQLEFREFIDGTNVIVRTFSSGGAPTLEIQLSDALKPLVAAFVKGRPTVKGIKIRY